MVYPKPGTYSSINNAQSLIDPKTCSRAPLLEKQPRRNSDWEASKTTYRIKNEDRCDTLGGKPADWAGDQAHVESREN